MPLQNRNFATKHLLHRQRQKPKCLAGSSKRHLVVDDRQNAVEGEMVEVE